jgi:proteasome lid subunit RPN8/RPN11
MKIPPGLRKEMLIHLESCLPEEGCGLLGGKPGHVSLVRPVLNELHSPSNFRMLPQDQFQAFLEIEKAGFDLIGMYHSHPQGPETLSETDLKEFAYPGVISLVCVPVGVDWIVRGFEIHGNRVKEISLT